MIHVFTGYDSREAIGWHVFTHSLLRHASRRVALYRLDACGLQQGTNAFTLSRFLVSSMMGFKGRAMFFDAADMLMLGDVAELDAMFDPSFAVQAVKHNYHTKHPRKYVGTDMEAANLDYPRKNWASAMLINCAHPSWAGLTAPAIASRNKLEMLQLKGIGPIGALPREWNVLADEGQPVDNARVLHWTAGIPAFPHYAKAPGADLWHAERAMIGL